ncbi:MAG: TetR/AcrR family transcriptional regulator [Solirubrobacterales bacterium]
MTRRRLKPEQRRAEIINAAFRSFISQPYADVSMAEIAEEAGASRALLTHYYGDKDSLYAAVIAHLVELLESMVRTDLDLEGRELIDANLTGILDLLIAQREAAISIFGGGPAGPDVVVAGAVRNFNSHIVERVLENHFGTTDVKPVTRVAVQGMIGYSQAVVLDWLKEETISREELHGLLASTLEAALAHEGNG